MGPQQEINTKGLREFGLVTGVIAGLLFGLLLPWLFGHGYPSWPWGVTFILILWALVWPTGLKPVYHGWMKVGHVLGWINTRIILGFMFFLMVLPVGFILRLFGKDPMRRRYEPEAESYRVDSEIPPRNYLERPF